MRSTPPASPRARVILVSGPGDASPSILARAETIGRLLARSGAVVLTGGRGGAMEAASRGARLEGGRTLAILPGRDRLKSPPNDSAELCVFTGMGEARNVILVLTADAVIAIGGGWGTLSEIALARKADRPVVLLDSWDARPADPRGLGEELPRASSEAEAVAMALEAARAAGD